MTKKKHPFETQKFSRLYACCYQRYKTGYEISQDMYGRYEKSNELQNLIRQHPDYFESKKHPSKKDVIMWRSKSLSLSNYIFNKTDITTDEKTKIKKILNLKTFRELVIFQHENYNIFSIIGIITICAGVTFSFLKIHKKYPEYFEKINLSKESILETTKDLMTPILPDAGKIFLDEPLTNNIHEIGNLFIELDHNTLQQLMRLTPALSVIPELLSTIFTQYYIINTEIDDTSPGVK